MIKLLHSVGVAIAVATVSLLAGCQLYFGSSDSSSPGNGGGGGGGGSPPGSQCNGDPQCAAGCFCANGICTEGGFCGSDKDCGAGFHCDINRASCVPNPTCTKDEQCTQGSMCDTGSGSCVATCTCANDADAVKAGFGWCDEARGTCMTGADPKGSCLGTISCTTAAPACPEGQVPLRKDGCFTGQCRSISACEGAPACSALQHQNDCTARNTDCAPVFTGHNCHGTTCGVSDADCTCEFYTFSACQDAGAPLTIIPGD
jgi:hypothetical protein